MQKAKLGDILQVNLSDDPAHPNWIQFWNHPLRDNEDVAHAQRVIDTRGMSFYTKPSHARDFRVRPLIEENITLDSLEV